MLLFFIVPFISQAQENQNITANYDDQALLEVIADLEQKTGYNFFYVNEWVNTIKSTANFENQTLTSVLDAILKETSINYYLLPKEKRVILLQNTLIYDELPLNFFGKPKDDEAVAIVRDGSRRPPPTFFNDEIRQTKKQFAITRIGKASPDNLKSTFTLKGKAVNNRTGEPIQDLAIRIKGSNLIAVTDVDGSYAMELPAGYHVLTTSAMGIEGTERELVLYNDGTLNLDLDESLEQLEEVVVEADAAKNVEEAISGSAQIDSEASKNIPLVLGERDILQVAKALPGISSAGEGATGLNVRGGKTDQNLVLLDDAVIYNPTHFFGIFQALNPFTTKGVDIYKGNVPVEYGGRLSSVFDIRTKNGNVQQIAGEGSVGPVTANLALEIPVTKDKSSVVIGARGAYADWILRSLDEESLNNSNASFFDGILKYHNRINDDNEVRATAYYSRDAFSITSDSLYNYSNRLFSGRWDHKFNDKTNAALTLTNSDYGFGIDFEGESNNDFKLDYDINETELKYKLRTALNEVHTLDYGVAGKLYKVNPGSIEPIGTNSNVAPQTIDEEQAIEGALYVGDEYEVNDKLLLSLGLRYAFFAAMGPATQRSYQEGQARNEATAQDTTAYGSGEVIKTYGGPEVRVAARYLLGPSLSIKAGFNNAYQFIHTLSNNTTVSPIDTWKLSDLNIEPQQGYQASLGIFKNLNDNQYEISLEGYYKRMDNVLDFKTGADLFLNENVETEVLQGDGKAYGVEFLLKKNR
ncbi:MAG: TonB-dependent receptor, partial [Croceitalea sp.]|nr:TonB-dependent receptor [Croceitalea sp.]